MRTKRVSLVAVMMTAIAVTGMATQIGDFEGSLDPGWQVTGTATGAISTDWASSGTSSLQVTPGPITGDNFAWALQFNDLATAEQLSSTHTLMFDVYWDSSEWLPDTDANAWVRWDSASLNSDATGWTQTSNSNMTDPANPSYPGSWDPNNWGATHQRTLEYDFTELGFDTTGATWAQFNVSINFGNVDTLGAYYIDNVRTVLIPEPGTLALVALGAMTLAAHRVRRRD